MSNNEKIIAKKLKDGLSQNQISKDMGVPRSLVQRISDKVLGIDPTTIKSLTTLQIIEIQKLLTDNVLSAREIATQYNISSKLVSRLKSVRISNHENNVTVVAPESSLADDGTFDKTTHLAPGGFARAKSSVSGFDRNTILYVAAFLEDRNQYVVAGPHESNVAIRFAKADELDIVTDIPDSNYFGGMGNVGFTAEMVDRVLNSGVARADGLDVFVQPIGESGRFPLSGKLNSKNQIGYIDPIIKNTVRVNINRVFFGYDKYAPQEEVVHETISTSKDLKGVNLDAFTQKHQILILDDQVVIVKDGKPLTITSEHHAYTAIVQAIKNQDINLAYDLMEPRKAVTKFTQGRLQFNKGTVTWDGHDITGHSVAKRFKEIAVKADINMLERLAKFMDKLYQNPSSQLIMSGRVFEFMAYADIEVDEDGDLIVYKAVKSNYLDKHSETIKNEPGALVRMARAFVNDNNNTLCSYGLHVCSLIYLRKLFSKSGDRCVRCKLNPKDIVSITNDYQSSKIRCCEYLVLDDYTDKFIRQYKSIDMEGFYK